MNIKIYTTIKKTQPFYSDAIQEYKKRLSRYAKTKIIKVKPSNLHKKVDTNSFIIKVSSNGNNISSSELANLLSELALSGNSDVSFVITNQEINDDKHLSLSQFDFSKELSLTVLFEQIYRSFTINNNLPYHK